MTTDHTGYYEQYGFSYDKEQFFVDYQLLGANIMPDVTVIERKN